MPFEDRIHRVGTDRTVVENSIVFWDLLKLLYMKMPSFGTSEQRKM